MALCFLVDGRVSRSLSCLVEIGLLRPLVLDIRMLRNMSGTRVIVQHWIKDSCILQNSFRSSDCFDRDAFGCLVCFRANVAPFLTAPQLFLFRCSSGLRCNYASLPSVSVADAIAKGDCLLPAERVARYLNAKPSEYLKLSEVILMVGERQLIWY